VRQRYAREKSALRRMRYSGWNRRCAIIMRDFGIHKGIVPSAAADGDSPLCKNWDSLQEFLPMQIFAYFLRITPVDFLDGFAVGGREFFGQDDLNFHQ
jgi:hypothetical protein